MKRGNTKAAALKIQLEDSLNTGELADVLFSLLENGHTLSDVVDIETGDTLLHWLCANAPLDILVHIFNTKVVDINMQNNAGETPLTQAAQYGKQSIISLLMFLGADPNIPDEFEDTARSYIKKSNRKLHLSPFDYEEIIIWKNKFKDAFNFKEQLALIEEILQKKGISLSTPIDEFDNSILHYLLDFSIDLEVIDNVLKKVKPGEINVKNNLEETPLHQACKSHSRVKMHALLSSGANIDIKDFNGISPKTLIKQDKSLMKMLEKNKTLDEYVDANSFLHKSLIKHNTVDAIQVLLENGFSLDEPIDQNDNSILHWLVEQAPFYILNEVLEKCNITNIDPQNSFGETPLMLAARNGRQLALSLLLTYGADSSITDDLGINAQDHALNANASVKFTSKLSKTSQEQTVYEHMLSYFDKYKNNIENLEGQKKVEFLFNTFNQYIEKLNWQYDGIATDYEQKILLDCNPNKKYIINCFDLSNAFLCILKAHGIIDAKTFIYEDIKSIPFSEKTDKIHGDFICFDKEVQSKSFEQGYFDFARHCVVKCEGKFYDPTFRCFYDNEQDIIDISNKDLEKDEDQDYIDIYVNVGEKTPQSYFGINGFLKNKNTLLNTNFSKNINTIFNPNQWEYLNRGRKIQVQNSKIDATFQIELDKDLDLITITSKNIEMPELAKYIVAWKKSIPNDIEIDFSIDSKNGNSASALQENLNVLGISANITEETPLSTALPKKSIIETTPKIEEPTIKSTSKKQKPIIQIPPIIEKPTIKSTSKVQQNAPQNTPPTEKKESLADMRRKFEVFQEQKEEALKKSVNPNSELPMSNNTPKKRKPNK